MVGSISRRWYLEYPILPKGTDVVSGWILECEGLLRLWIESAANWCVCVAAQWRDLSRKGMISICG